jgi:hypothetical protein
MLVGGWDGWGWDYIKMLNLFYLCCEFNVFIEALERLEVTEVKLLCAGRRVYLGRIEIGNEAHAQFANAPRREQEL